MNTVSVNASRNYDVLIGSGILSSIGQRIAELGAVKVAIISDSNVWPLYGAGVTQDLRNAGIETSC